MCDFTGPQSPDSESAVNSSGGTKDASDPRFTTYNVRLQASLKKARERQQDSSSVFQLPDAKPAKTDSYAGRLKSQIRRLRERNNVKATENAGGECAEASKQPVDDAGQELGFTD